MKGPPYTCIEIILCTYVARFGRDYIDETKISNKYGRKVSSLKMKVRNIAALRHYNGPSASPNKLALGARVC